MRLERFEVKEMNKKVLFGILYSMAALITLSGILFSIYGFLTNATFKIMGSDFPGAIFGLVAAFLGVRYTLSLNKLKKKIEASNASFSWSNFKRSHSV